MNWTFDDFTRHIAVALDRRSFLSGLGGALLAAGTPITVSMAKKKGKGKKGKGKKKSHPACRRRGSFCRQEFFENCRDQDVDDSEACLRAINRCCNQGTRCKVRSTDRLFQLCADVLCRFKDFC